VSVLRLNLLTLAACVSALPALGGVTTEAGAYYLQSYSPKTYDALPQNWAIAQDHRGVMYFGNTNCLLEYDGATWRKILLPESSPVRSLAVDESGTVYVGGEGEIGYLKPDQAGGLQYTSLLNYIPQDDRNFSNVWSIAVTKSGVLFGANERLFRWSPPDRMKVWRPSSRFGRVFVPHGVPYVYADDSGLNRIDGDNLQPVPGGDLFAHTPLRAVLSLNGSLVAVTADRVYRFDGARFADFPLSPQDAIRDSKIYSAVFLKDGTLALGTVGRGLLLVDSSGALDRIVDKRDGLDSNSVNALYIDRHGALWLALARGLARVEIGAGLTHFSDPEGLPEIVDAIEREGGSLYAGTLVGLSRLHPAEHATASFEPVAGAKGQIFALLATHGTLLAAGQPGLLEIRNDAARLISAPDLLYALAPSQKNPAIVYAAGRGGLFVFRHDSDWRMIRQIPSSGADLQSVIEDSDRTVWVTTQTQIWRINWNAEPPAVERFTSGIPAGFKNIYRIEGEILFATPKGLLHFNAATKTFDPEPRFGKMFADGSHPVSMIAEGPGGQIWISGSGYHGVLLKSDAARMEWHERLLARAGIEELYALHLDLTGVVWASGVDSGLVRYEPAATHVNDPGFRAMVRRVETLSGNQIIFDGGGVVPDARPLQHQQNGLKFEFAAPSFEDDSRTQYQVELQGLDRTWSAWNSQTQEEYTNLFEGNYTFRVRARDLFGNLSGEDSFGFRVFPPWYRTWWAYLLDLILFSAAVWLFLKWRLVALAERNRKLEAVVEIRTDEIRKQRDEIKVQEAKTNALLLNILPERVAEELRSTGTVKPVACDDITVCFTDFVGFTLSSEKLSPSALVTALHSYFTEFDAIVDRYGLEKLKTIGDSYMFVSGLPVSRPSHAVDAVLAALEIVEVVKNLVHAGPAWRVRVGLHSGPVVAGVVGVRKFAFDIWGPTVNFASRFESSSWPNHVNFSTHTYDLVKDFIDCSPRGDIRIKEGRHLQMYFANGIRPELQANFAQVYERRFGYPPLYTAALLAGQASPAPAEP
jgi:class 3 adenylate cyclase